jgi:hypothetical protein
MSISKNTPRPRYCTFQTGMGKYSIDAKATHKASQHTGMTNRDNAPIKGSMVIVQ